MKVRNFTIIMKPEPEGGFTVVVPSLPGCVTYGKNLKQAKSMAKEAIASYIASLKKHHEPIPSDELSFFTTVNLPEPSVKPVYT